MTLINFLNSSFSNTFGAGFGGETVTPLASSAQPEGVDEAETSGEAFSFISLQSPLFNSTINGTNGDDVLTGTNDDDVITTFAGNDTVNALGGDDLIIGDANGSGFIDGGDGFDTVRINSDNFLSARFDTINDVLLEIGGYSLLSVERVEIIDQNGDFRSYFETGTSLSLIHI